MKWKRPWRNFTEHVTAVTVSVKDKLTLSIGVAVGSSIVSLDPATNYFIDANLHIPAANSTLCDSVRSTSLRKWEAMLTGPIHRFIVILAWILDKPLTLLFDPYESVTLFLAGEVVHIAMMRWTVYNSSSSPYSELRGTRWEIKLAGRHDSDVYEKSFTKWYQPNLWDLLEQACMLSLVSHSGSIYPVWSVTLTPRMYDSPSLVNPITC